MRAAYRGLRNLGRNKARAGLVIVLLGLTVGVALTMALTARRIDATASGLQATVETLIEVRAAGSTAMGRGVEPLGPEIAEGVRQVPRVASVEEYLYVRQVDNARKYPVSVIAGLAPITGELRVNSHGEVGTPRIISGRQFDPQDAGRAVAVVGTTYADQNGLNLGSELLLAGASLEVIGIFDSGFVFGNNQVFVPLTVAQELAYQLGDISDRDRVSNVYATVDSVDRVRDVERALRDVLGGAVDVLSGQQNAAIAADALRGIRFGSVIGAAASGVGAALLVLSAMLLITRERTREIGMLKALGAPHLSVITQFLSEALALSLAGAVLGIGLSALVGPLIADRLLGLSATSLTGLTGAMGSQPALDVVAPSFSAAYAGYALLLALALGALGSVYPAFAAARLLPADALRYE